VTLHCRVVADVVDVAFADGKIVLVVLPVDVGGGLVVSVEICLVVGPAGEIVDVTFNVAVK